MTNTWSEHIYYCSKNNVPKTLYMQNHRHTVYSCAQFCYLNMAMNILLNGTSIFVSWSSVSSVLHWKLVTERHAPCRFDGSVDVCNSETIAQPSDTLMQNTTNALHITVPLYKYTLEIQHASAYVCIHCYAHWEIHCSQRVLASYGLYTLLF